MDNLPERKKENIFNIEKSPIKEAYILLNARNPLELSNRYSAEDQKLMRSSSWDYNNPVLIVNRVKNIIEAVNPQKLKGKEKEWTQEILWFWYHHAVSCAVWRYKDKKRAEVYTKKALEFQSVDHPNKITKLFDMLLKGKLEEAKKKAKDITEEPEKSTALGVIKEWPNF